MTRRHGRGSERASGSARPAKSGPSSRAADAAGAAFGCAGIASFFAVFIVFLGYHNHAFWLARQQQIPRFQKVRATIREKGVATYDRRDSNNRHTTESQKWIHFTCRLADGTERDGARLGFSGSDFGWEAFQQGAQYDAYYDPGVNECVLLLDESVGEPDAGLRSFLTMAGLLAGLAAALVAGGLIARMRA